MTPFFLALEKAFPLFVSLSTQWPSEPVRIFHGRGGEFKGLEGLTIEWYPPILLIFIHKEKSKEEMEKVENFFSQLIGVESMAIRYKNSDGSLHWKMLKGIFSTDGDIITENNIRYKIKIGKNQNIGFFLDMAILRQNLFHESQGKKILNLFSYTCSLSVAASLGGAQEIHNIDMKKNFLSWGRENHHLNDILKNIYYHPINILKSFNRIKRFGPFDLIIVDPPTQQENFEFHRDYPKILKRIGDWVSPQGQIIVTANSPLLSEQDFLEFLNPYLKEKFLFQQWIRPSVPLIGKEMSNELKIALYSFK